MDINQAGTPSPSPTTPHDSMYKDFFSYPEAVQSLVQEFAPDIAANLDFATLEPYPTEHVLEGLRQVRNDCIWKVQRTDGTSCFVVIMLEFQSTTDRWMALRVLGYCYGLWNSMVERGEIAADGLLPPIFPFVLYNGKPVWNAALNMRDLIVPAGPLDAYQPSLTYFLLDEGRKTGQDLAAGNGLATALVRLEQSRTPDEAREHLRQLFGLLQDPRYEILRTNLAIWASLGGVPHGAATGNENVLPEEKSMSLLHENMKEYYVNEGEAKGKLSQAFESAKLMLKAGKLQLSEVLSFFPVLSSQDVEKLRAELSAA